MPPCEVADRECPTDGVHSNHGTFYYNQLAALQILVGDTAGAKQTLEEYFTTQYTWQIAANGDQVSLRAIRIDLVTLAYPILYPSLSRPPGRAPTTTGRTTSPP